MGLVQRLLARFGYVKVRDHGLILTSDGRLLPMAGSGWPPGLPASSPTMAAPPQAPGPNAPYPPNPSAPVTASPPAPPSPYGYAMQGGGMPAPTTAKAPAARAPEQPSVVLGSSEPLPEPQVYEALGTPQPEQGGTPAPMSTVLHRTLDELSAEAAPSPRHPVADPLRQSQRRPARSRFPTLGEQGRTVAVPTAMSKLAASVTGPAEVLVKG